MMKRTLALLLTATFILSLLVGCATTSTNTGSPDTTAEDEPGTTPGTSDTVISVPTSTSTPTPTSTSTPAPTLTPTPTPENKEIYEETVGDIRVQLYSDTLFRLEKREKTGFCDNETIAIANRKVWEGVDVVKTEDDQNVILTTSNYVITIPQNATTLENVKVTDPKGESLWKYSKNEDALTYLPEPSETPKCWSFNDNPRINVSDAHFLPPENEEDYLPNNGWTEEKQVSDFYVFVPMNDTMTLRRDFVLLTGQCDLVPIKTLGLWFSRWHAYNAKEYLALIDSYRKHGYPIDMIVCDTDWRSSSDGTGYKMNMSLFPNVKNFFKQAANKNVGILFNDHVHDSSASLLSYEQLTWFYKGITDKLSDGLSAWWYDRNWTYTLKSPFSSIHGDMLGQYMYLWYSQYYREINEINQRTFLLSNIYWNRHGNIESQPHVSTHRYSIQWTGDIASDYKNIQNELEKMVYTGAVSAIGYFSSDIGGNTGNPEEPLFIRWLQYGALSPIMRLHSTWGVDRSPWTVGEAADEVGKTYVNMRYRLMPLYYTLAYENYSSGLPLARRLDFYYPQYKESTSNTQYLLGEDILVAPIYSSTSQSVVPSSWLITKDGKAGLDAQYYNNTSFSGEAVLTRVDKNIDFDWAQGSPAAGVKSDYFSIVWEGNITPDADVWLGTLSDDGVRVYIDGERIVDNWKASNSVLVMSSKTLEKNKTYKIRVEYYDEAYDAKIKLMYTHTYDNRFELEDKRSVFIPDGTWINVFSGEKFVGPKTIEVSVNSYQMPIFVKEGSVILLAPEGEYADTGNFKNLTLDVYAGGNSGDTTTLYEDDGKTEDYKKGSYMITTVTSESKDGKLTLSITPEIYGGYKSSFEERSYTLRIHGSDYKKVIIGDKEYSLEKIAKNASAAPFSISGGAADSDILTVTFTAGIGETITLTAQ